MEKVCVQTRFGGHTSVKVNQLIQKVNRVVEHVGSTSPMGLDIIELQTIAHDLASYCKKMGPHEAEIEAVIARKMANRKTSGNSALRKPRVRQ